MTTGQTLLTLVAFVFLSTVLMNFYGTSASTGNGISSGQDGILATTISTSYFEIAQGLSFDEVTDTSTIAVDSAAALTSPGLLGREAGEDSIHQFDDLDDFNRFSAEKVAGGTGRRYRTTARVHYVAPEDIQKIATTQTFLKRIDLTTWRTFPPPASNTDLDTLRMSLVLGYFTFN